MQVRKRRAVRELQRRPRVLEVEDGLIVVAQRGEHVKVVPLQHRLRGGRVHGVEHRIVQAVGIADVGEWCGVVGSWASSGLRGALVGGYRGGLGW